MNLFRLAFLKIIAKITLYITIAKFILILAILSIFLGTTGLLGSRCVGPSSFGSTSYSLEEMVIPADGNHYTIGTSGEATEIDFTNYSDSVHLTKHPDHYGEWYNTEIGVDKSTEVVLTIYGTISLENSTIKRRICANNEYTTPFGYYSGDNQTVCTDSYTPPLEAEITPLVVDGDTTVSITSAGLFSCDIFSKTEKASDGVTSLYNACLSSPQSYLTNYSTNNYLIYNTDLSSENIPSDACQDYRLFNLIGYRIFVGDTEIFDGNSVTDIASKAVTRVPNRGIDINGLALGVSGTLSFQAVDPPEDYYISYDRYYDITAQYNKKYITNANPGNGTDGMVEVYIGNNDPNEVTPSAGETMLVSSGETISNTGSNESTLWIRAYDSGSYEDNRGAYWITVATTETDTDSNIYTGWIFKYLVSPIQTAVASATREIYERTVMDEVFQTLVRTVITLSVAILGYKYLVGAVQKPLSELVYYVLKVGFISTLLATDTSWEFFNSHLFVFFTEGTDALINAALETDNPFSFLEKGTRLFLNTSTWIKVVGLLFVPAMSILVVFLFIMMFIFYCQVAIEAVRVYLFCTIVVGFLVSLAPIFISFILFQLTREFFKNWIKTLAMITMYPFVVLLALNIINDFVMNFLVASLNFKVCVNTIWQIKVLNYSALDLGSWGPLGNVSIPLDWVTWNIKAYTLDYDSIGTDSTLNLSGSFAGSQLYSAMYLLVNTFIAYLFVSMGKKFVHEFAPSVVGRLFGEYQLESFVGGGQATDLIKIGTDKGKEDKNEKEAKAAKKG